jgi:hypothetical protein
MGSSSLLGLQGDRPTVESSEVIRSAPQLPLATMCIITAGLPAASTSQAGVQPSALISLCATRLLDGCWWHVFLLVLMLVKLRCGCSQHWQILVVVPGSGGPNSVSEHCM